MKTKGPNVLFILFLAATAWFMAVGMFATVIGLLAWWSI